MNAELNDFKSNFCQQMFLFCAYNDSVYTPHETPTATGIYYTVITEWKETV